MILEGWFLRFWEEWDFSYDFLVFIFPILKKTIPFQKDLFQQIQHCWSKSIFGSLWVPMRCSCIGPAAMYPRRSLLVLCVSSRSDASVLLPPRCSLVAQAIETQAQYWSRPPPAGGRIQVRCLPLLRSRLPMCQDRSATGDRVAFCSNICARTRRSAEEQ